MDEIKYIIDNICTDDTKNYKCYDTLINLLKNDDKFRKIILKGISEGKITGFSTDLWKKLESQNIRAPGVKSFTEVFRDGYNQGYCTSCSTQVSYSFNACYICGGSLPILVGTTNCPNGDHTWLEVDNYVIDTTLMMTIDKSFAEEIGYVLDNKYNPNTNPNYRAAKEYTNDSSFKSHKSR